MDKLWGDRVVKLRAENAERGQLFDEGNYAMFIHWGLYSQLANKGDGKSYYGIGEWIMNPRMAGIPVPEYKKLAGRFNPVKFDAKGIAKLARAAGMQTLGDMEVPHHNIEGLWESVDRTNDSWAYAIERLSAPVKIMIVSSGRLP